MSPLLLSLPSRLSRRLRSALALAAAAALLIPLAAPTPLFAAKINNLKNPAIFIITVDGTAQEFVGRADRVISISFQEYIAGPLHVSEVVVDMAGSNQLLRLYASRPFSAEDAAAAARTAAGAAGDLTHGTINPTVPTVPGPIAQADAAVQTAYSRATAGIVVKSWPATTHAKTIEFSVTDRAELISFYSTFRDLFLSRPIRAKADGVLVSASSTEAASAIVFSRIGGVHFHTH
jgi:hypothetical protein